MRVPSLIALALAPAVLGAQADPGRGAVEGTVYDSVAGRFLTGATVQMVNAAAPAGALLSALTDAHGRFAIQAVVPGRYLVGFHHHALDSLALEAATVVVDVRAGGTARLALAVPSPAWVVATACRAAAADSIGLLLGVLRDATSGNARARGRVHARWTDIVIDSTGISRQDGRAESDVGEDGWFALCLPAAEGVAVSASSGADSSGVQLVNVPANGLLRHDVAFGGTALVRGRVRVRGDDDRPVAHARVGFAGTSLVTTTDTAGGFVLQGSAGSHTFEARALGYVADRVALHLRAGTDTTVDVTLLPLEGLLDTVRVVARRLYSRDSDGFERRRRAGNGRFWDADDIARARWLNIYDVLRQVPSIRIEEFGFDRYVSMRGGKEGRCVPVVFYNGVRLEPAVIGQLDMLVGPADLSGIELYTESQVPAQFQTLEGCGSLLIWSRPRPRRSGGREGSTPPGH